MQDSDTLVKGLNRSIPDYTCDINHARELASRVQDYYHSRGYTGVKCWIEPTTSPNGLIKMYSVKSNIVFDVGQLVKKYKGTSQ